MEHWAQCSGVDPHQPYCEQQEPSAQILSPTHPEPHVPLAIDCCVGTPNICGLAGLRTLVEGCVGEVLDGLEAGGNGENGLLAITAGFEEFGALGLGAKGEGAVGLPPQYSWVVPHQPNCEQHEPSGQIPSPMEPPPHVPLATGEGGLTGLPAGDEGFVGFLPQYSEEVPHQPNCEQHEPSGQIPSPMEPPPHVPFAVGEGGLIGPFTGTEGFVGFPPQYSEEVPHHPNGEQHEPSGQIPSPMEPPPHVPFVAGEGGLIGPFTGTEGFVGFPPQYSEEVPHQPNGEQHEPSGQIPSPMEPPPHVPFAADEGGLIGPFTGAEGFVGFPPQYSEEVPHQPNCEQHEPSEQIPFPTDPPPHVPPDPLGIFALGAKGEDLVRFGDEGVGLIGVPIDVGFVKLGMEGSRGVGFGPKGACLIGMTAEGEGLVGLNGGASFGALGIATEGDGIPGVIGFLKLGFEGVL